MQTLGIVAANKYGPIFFEPVGADHKPLAAQLSRLLVARWSGTEAKLQQAFLHTFLKGKNNIE